MICCTAWCEIFAYSAITSDVVNWISETFRLMCKIPNSSHFCNNFLTWRIRYEKNNCPYSRNTYDSNAYWMWWRYGRSSKAKDPYESALSPEPETPSPVLSAKLETAEDYANALKDAGLPIWKIEVWTAETDPNEKLGRPNEYTSKIDFEAGEI